MTKEEKTRVESIGLGKYRVEAIILREGLNPHLTRRVSKFPYTLTYDGTSYEVKDTALFGRKLKFTKKITNIVKLIVADYVILFWEGESDPIMRFHSKVDPEVILTARDSKAVTRMIKEWFSDRRFPLNKWVFIFLVALVGTLIYAKMSGRF